MLLFTENILIPKTGIHIQQLFPWGLGTSGVLAGLRTQEGLFALTGAWDLGQELPIAWGDPQSP